MMMPFLRVAGIAGLLFAAAPASAKAQAASGDTVARTWRSGPLRLWLAGGLGPSSFFQASGAAARSSITVAYGRAVVFRRSLAAFDGIDGYLSTDETSLLAGYRSPGRHRYYILALGSASTIWQDGHGYCASPCAFRYESNGVAYDLGVHATRMLGGFAVNVSGVVGPPKARVLAVVLSPELGWFGR
jgi:hypothetical protein